MVAEGQVPPDEPTSNTLEEFSNRFLTIFWSRQHALDRVRSVPTTRDVDWHGISPGYFDCSISCRISRLTRAAVALNFSPRRLRAAGLQTQRSSLAPLVTEEPSLADLHARKSEARFGHQEIPVHRDERRLFLC